MSYAKGRRFEYRAKEKLEKAGFYVMRSAGSHGVFDLLAVKPGVVLGVQCKENGRLTKAEFKEIMTTAERYGITPILAYKENRTVVFRELKPSKTAKSG